MLIPDPPRRSPERSNRVGAPVPRSLARALIGASLVLLAGQAAGAHGIESNLERLGGLSQGLNVNAPALSTAAGRPGPAQAARDTLRLESHFSSGLPASDALVRLVPPGGTPIVVGRTDARGTLSFRLPAGAQSSWEVQVDAGPGHRDYLELPGQQPGPAAGIQGRSHSSPIARLWGTLSPGMIGGLAMVGLLGGLLLRRRHG